MIVLGGAFSSGGCGPNGPFPLMCCFETDARCFFGGSARRPNGFADCRWQLQHGPHMFASFHSFIHSHTHTPTHTHTHTDTLFSAAEHGCCMVLVHHKYPGINSASRRCQTQTRLIRAAWPKSKVAAPEHIMDMTCLGAIGRGRRR